MKSYGILLVICIYYISFIPVNASHIRGHPGPHPHHHHHHRGHHLLRRRPNATVSNISGGKPVSVSKPLSEPVSKPVSRPIRPPLLAPPSVNQDSESHAVVNGNPLGCNKRPTCAGSIEDPTHCVPGEYHADSCWCNVYYECSYSPDGSAVVSPFVCSEGLVVNPAGLGGGEVCDWPFKVASNPDSITNCGCPAYCATPPTCPAVHLPDKDVDCQTSDSESEPETPPAEKNHVQTSQGEPDLEPNNVHNCARGDCYGTVLIPHQCDCQFFWLCGPEQIPVLKACGPNEIFVPEPNHGGVCAPGFPSSCTRGCLSDGKLCACPEPHVPEPPKPDQRRHPLVAIFLAQNQTLPKHLEHYGKIVYEDN